MKGDQEGTVGQVDEVGELGRYEDLERRVPDGSKAEAVLGFRARVSLEEGLRKAIDWQRAAMQRLGML